MRRSIVYICLSDLTSLGVAVCSKGLDMTRITTLIPDTAISMDPFISSNIVIVKSCKLQSKASTVPGQSRTARREQRRRFSYP